MQQSSKIKVYLMEGCGYCKPYKQIAKDLADAGVIELYGLEEGQRDGVLGFPAVYQNGQQVDPQILHSLAAQTFRADTVTAKPAGIDPWVKKGALVLALAFLVKNIRV